MSDRVHAARVLLKIVEGSRGIASLLKYEPELVRHQTHTHKRIHTHTNTCTNTHTHRHADNTHLNTRHTHIHVRTYARSATHEPPCSQEFVRTGLFARTRKCMHTTCPNEACQTFECIMSHRVRLVTRMNTSYYTVILHVTHGCVGLHMITSCCT